MFKNYFITAYRNFIRNKIFSLINVLGLSVGISAALVIFLIVRYEFSYDKIETGAGQIYRVVLDANFNGVEGHSAGIPAPISGAMQQEMTGLESVVPVMQFQGDASAKVTISGTNEQHTVFKKQDGIIFTTGQYFSLLPFRWIVGSPQGALKNPFSIVLTESRAHQYFPDIPLSDIPGRQIRYNDDFSATVSGIVKDLTQHASLTASEFLSYATIAKTHLQNQFMMNVWDDWMAYSQLYIKLAKGVSSQRIETQLNGLYKKYNPDADKGQGHAIALRLQPLRDVHFNYQYAGLGQRIAHKSTLYGLLAVAAFLLLLGCINFINLTTAQASQRAKEIGIKKTLGSSKKALVWQFLGETFFTTAIATGISVILTPLFLNMFNGFIPPGLHFNLKHQPDVFVFLLILCIFVSLVSGLYPAFVLSQYKPLVALKDQALGFGHTRSSRIRKILTVSQFAIAQFFLIVSITVVKQIRYSLNADMGFNKEAIINFYLPHDTAASHSQILLTQIKSLPGVALATSGFLPPADNGVAFTNIAYYDGKEKRTPSTQIRWGSPDYIKMYKIKILAGRNVMPSDTIKEFLANESFAHAIGFVHAGDAVGSQVQWNGRDLLIVGIMKDFHDQSMRQKISPMVFGAAKGDIFHVELRPRNGNKMLWTNTIAAIKKAYDKQYPGADFEYSFLDDTIARFYETEQNTARLLKWATALAILISCLGLTGLVVFTTNVRTREIGIRKILGASVVQIISLLSKDFILLVVFAYALAAPVSWIVMQKWLEDFAYRTNLSWGIFIASGLAMLIMALAVLGIRAAKKAMANPVNSLRSE